MGKTTAAIAEALTEWAAAPVQVRAIRPLSGRASRADLRVELSAAGGRLEGTERLVLRTDAREPTPGSLDRGTELAVVEAVRRAGVTTPEGFAPSSGLLREGASAYFVRWAPGVADGAQVVRDPSLLEARRKLTAQLAQELARIHSVRPEEHPELQFASPPSASGADACGPALASLRQQLVRLAEPRPALEYAWRWLRENPPPRAEITLVHGDFCTGNFLVTPDGLAAILDWELAHFSDPMQDIATLCVRDRRFGRIDRPVGGFGQRGTLYETYEAASGRAVDPAAVHWWEVLGNARCAVSAILQGERYLAGRERDLELLAVARRAAEMEFEALRCLQAGPIRP